MTATVIAFPESAIVRLVSPTPNTVVESSDTTLDPKIQKKIQTICDDIMVGIDVKLTEYLLGQLADEIGTKEYCLVQQAVLSMIQKIFAQRHPLQVYADYAINLTSNNSDGSAEYTMSIPLIAIPSTDDEGVVTGYEILEVSDPENELIEEESN